MHKKTKIVIIGGGFGGVYTYKYLHEIFHKDRSIELVMVSAQNYFMFTPLLHEVATGAQPQNNIVEPLRNQLCCLSDLYVTRAETLDPEKKIIHTTCGDITYDYVVLALGATSNFFGTKGTDKYVHTLKSLEDALALKKKIIQNIEQASHLSTKKEREPYLNFVVVGGGPTGVELAAEMADMLYHSIMPLYDKKLLQEELNITLIQADKDILPMYKEPLRKKAYTVLTKHGVTVLRSTMVKEITKDAVLYDTKKITTNTVIWTAGVAPNTIETTQNIARTKQGHILTNEFLHSQTDEYVYALGDSASFTNPGAERPIPATAQAAVAQAEYVALNIARSIKKQALKPFVYHEKGALVSLGRWNAGATIFGITFSGKLAWWIWRTVYLFKLLSWQKKVKVALDWTIHLFSKRDISEV